MNTKQMSIEALQYTAADLLQVIQAQEPMARAGYRCPKRGLYYDQLAQVRQEMASRRQRRIGRRQAATLTGNDR
jgi:hypothetical protein